MSIENDPWGTHFEEKLTQVLEEHMIEMCGVLTSGMNKYTLEIKELREEVNELKSRMPAEDPCDEDHMREIGS